MSLPDCSQSLMIASSVSGGLGVGPAFSVAKSVSSARPSHFGRGRAVGGAHGRCGLLGTAAGRRGQGEESECSKRRGIRIIGRR